MKTATSYLLLLAGLPAAAAHHPAGEHVVLSKAEQISYAQRYEPTKADDGRLELDEAYFWHQSRTFDGRAMSCDEDSCETYSLELVPGGARLRVGIATPERSDTFALEIYDPSGELLGSDSTSNQFNSEAQVDNPQAGVWTVVVRAEDVDRASYRLRAKLESVTPESVIATSEANRRPLYPNLRTVPPYEFTFTAPLNPLNGIYPPDTINPPASVAGITLASCSIDEYLPTEAGGADAKHCLRLTSGPINIGEGIYDMRFRLLEDFIAGNAELNPEEAFSRLVVGDMKQAVHYSDGSIEYVEAGTYSFHPTHAHFHDDYILSYYLALVTDPVSGEFHRVGTGTKSGFCPADQLWGDWRAFAQGTEVPGGDSPLSSCFSVTDGFVGLSVGWGDVYRWQRPGQYVEFDGQGNGRYVINAVVDEYNNVIESDETDNVSYAYVEIQGDNITILERGWGESPWDPNKQVFTGPHPTQRASDYGLAEDSAARSVDTRGAGAVGVWLLGLSAALMWRRRRPSRAV